MLFAVEFLLVYRGLVWTTATRGVLFLYAAPFFIVIGSRLFIPGDHFYPSQWFGLALSFVGIVIAFGLPTPAADPRQLLGDLMLLGGGAAWAATTLVIKASPLSRISAEKTVLYQLVVSAPLLAIGALVLGERMDAMPSALALGGLRLPGPMGRQRELRDLVRADRALLRQQTIGIYFPDPDFRGRRRLSLS